MPSQDECADLPAHKPVQVRVGLAPRAQPFDESMDSLNRAIGTARAAGFNINFEKIRRGAPGFQNAGPIFAHMLSDGDTHVFFAGDDVLYSPDAIVRLVGANKDIVSGLYRKNKLDSIEPANWAESAEKFVEQFKTSGVYEAEYAACHSMTVKRAVIEKMVLDYPELAYDFAGEVHYGLFLPIIEDRQAFQDDWAFSIRAKRSGFKIWNDFGCQLKHYCGDFLGFENLEA